MLTSRWTRLFVVLPTLLVAFSRTVVHAEPLVRVRAESRIELGVAHESSGMLISGALRDELGAPLTGRGLALEAFAENEPGEPWRTQLTTDESGRFALELADSEHDYRLLATFAGDTTHRGVRVERRVERARADVRLELRLPGGSVVDLDAQDLLVEALAESDAGGEGISMRLTDESGRMMAGGTTDANGRLTLRIPCGSIGSPGAGLLRLESARDARRAEAQTEARVVRRRSVSIALHPRRDTFEAGGRIQIRGSVRTAVAPRSNVPVGLFAHERHLETQVTDENGEFEADLWIDSQPGELEIRARTEADATGAYPAAENRVTLHVTPAKPVPVLWLAAASAVLAGALWLAGRTRRSQVLEGAASLGSGEREAMGSSIVPARPQGKRDRLLIQGRTVDARGRHPIPDAEVQLLHEDPAGCCTLRTDVEGRFTSLALPAGRVRLLVQAPGYVATQSDFEVPHRGEWTAFEIKLESLRDRALAPFRRLALRALPSARVWGIWTNRETREWLAKQAPRRQAALGQLTLDLERVCYGSEPPSEAEVVEIERVAKAVEADLAGGTPNETAQETRSAR